LPLVGKTNRASFFRPCEERQRRSNPFFVAWLRWIASLTLAMTGCDRKKQWAMTVNDRWRICFEFRKGDAFEVEIVDYHKG
jgi:RelE-like toxin of type II toxin-antitoxin system HigB